MGMAAARSALRDASTLRSPIWIVPGVTSWLNMLAPPASLATRRRGSAPSALRRSISSGTAVFGDFAPFLKLRAGPGAAQQPSAPASRLVLGVRVLVPT